MHVCFCTVFNIPLYTYSHYVLLKCCSLCVLFVSPLCFHTHLGIIITVHLGISSLGLCLVFQISISSFVYLISLYIERYLNHQWKTNLGFIFLVPNLFFTFSFSHFSKWHHQCPWTFSLIFLLQYSICVTQRNSILILFISYLVSST